MQCAGWGRGFAQFTPTQQWRVKLGNSSAVFTCPATSKDSHNLNISKHMKVQQKTKKRTNGFQTELTTSRLKIFFRLARLKGTAWLVKPQGNHNSTAMSMPIWRNSTRAPDFSFFNQSVQAVLIPFFTLIPLEVIKPGLLIRYASCSNQTQSNNCSTLHFKMGSWGHLEFIQ